MAKVAFTAGRVAGFKCPATKAQAFRWDSTAPGLGLRVTPAGKPAYVFQSRFQAQTVRLTIGGPDAWTIPQAQERARELQRQIDEGRDPRAVKAEATAADVAKRADEQRQHVTAREAWDAYAVRSDRAGGGDEYLCVCRGESDFVRRSGWAARWCGSATVDIQPGDSDARSAASTYVELHALESFRR